MSTSIYTADNREIKLPAGTDSVDISVLTTDLQNLTQSVNLALGSGGNSSDINLTGKFTSTGSNIDHIKSDAHNMIYRGAFLGNKITDTQLTAISSGNFTNMYLGDYWEFKNISIELGSNTFLSTSYNTPNITTGTTTTCTVTATIVGFNYYYGTTALSTVSSGKNRYNLVVILSFSPGLYAPMNTDGTYTTTTDSSGKTINTYTPKAIDGAYKSTSMCTKTLPALEKAICTEDTGLNDHMGDCTSSNSVVKLYLPSANKVDSSFVNYPTTQEFTPVGLFLPTEENIYGHAVRTESPRHYYSFDSAQYPIFANTGAHIRGARYYGWLRDMYSTSSFAFAYAGGIVSTATVSTVDYVRPAMIIY